MARSVAMLQYHTFEICAVTRLRVKKDHRRCKFLGLTHFAIVHCPNSLHFPLSNYRDIVYLLSIENRVFMRLSNCSGQYLWFM